PRLNHGPTKEIDPVTCATRIERTSSPTATQAGATPPPPPAGAGSSLIPAPKMFDRAGTRTVRSAGHDPSEATGGRDAARLRDPSFEDGSPDLGSPMGSP